MSSSIVKVPNGGTVQVRTGVLRGAGPQGPMGPSGPAGAAGPAGPVGPAGAINDVQGHLTSTAAVAVGGENQWYTLPFETSVITDVFSSTGVNGVGFIYKETGYYALVIRVRFEPRAGTDGGTAVAGGSRRIRVVDQAGNVVHEMSAAAAPTEPTILNLVTIAQPNSTYAYTVQAYSDDSAGVNVTSRSLKIGRFGSGPAGVAGPAGPVGLTGPVGPQGPAGNAGAGYASFDAVNGGTDSTADPGTATFATADQGLIAPLGGSAPRTPWYIRRALTSLERLLVGVFASAADRTAKRAARNAGEVTYLSDTGQLQLREKAGVDYDVARVVLSHNAPPAGAGQAAPGVIWAQY